MAKKKISIIISAIAICAICMSMIVGSTLALFSSNDTVDISITAGKVSIKAEVVPGESKSTLGNGTALGQFNTKNGLALENIVPGDVYGFTVKADNTSSISVQYRTTIELTNPVLAAALNITIDGVTYSGLTKYTTAWAVVDGAIDDMNVEIAFPASEESQNHLQGLSTDIIVTVEGIQANASVSDADVALVLSVNNGDQLEAAVELAKELNQNAIINLVSDVALSEELYIDRLASDLTINGNGHKITAADNFAMNLEGQFNLVKINDAVAKYDENNNLIGYDIKIHDNTVALQNIVLEHKSVESTGSYHTLDIYGAQNVVLDNVSIIRNVASAKGGAAMVVNASNVVANDLSVAIGGSAWGGINVDGINGDANVILKSGFTATAANGVAVWLENGGTVVDEENVLVNITETVYTVASAKLGDNAYTNVDDAIAALRSQENVTLSLHCDVAIDSNAALKNLKNVEIDANGCEIVFTSKGVASLGGENVVVRNAVFTAKSAPWGICGDGVSFYNCTFDGISPYLDGSKPIVIDGCTIINTTLQFGERADFSNVTITNNTFVVNNTDAGSHAIVLNHSAKDKDAAKLFWENGAEGLVIEGNTFTAVNDARYIAYYITVGGVTLESAPVYSNNVYNGEAYYSMNDVAVVNQTKLN